MNITININTDNDGFQESMNGETARILERLSLRLNRDEIDIHIGERVSLFDSNGNNIGQLEVTK